MSDPHASAPDATGSSTCDKAQPAGFAEVIGADLFLLGAALRGALQPKNWGLGLAIVLALWLPTAAQMTWFSQRPLRVNPTYEFFGLVDPIVKSDAARYEYSLRSIAHDGVLGVVACLHEVFETVVRALAIADSNGGSWANALGALIRLLWMGAVFAVLGGTLARRQGHLIAESWGGRLRRSFRFAADNVVHYFTGALLLATAVVVLTGPLRLLHWTNRLAMDARGHMPLSVACLTQAIAVPLALLRSAIVLLWVVGWPLMVASVSSEGIDGFDALARLRHYVARGLVPVAWLAALYGVLGGTIVWGAFTALRMLILLFPEPWNAQMTWEWNGYEVTPWGTRDLTLRYLAAGLMWSYFFLAYVGVYRSLRLRIDGVPVREMWDAPMPTAAADSPSPAGAAADAAASAPAEGSTTGTTAEP